MKVLFITHTTPMDGGNLSLLQLMKELKGSYNVTPCLLAPLEVTEASSSIIAESRKNGIECLETRFYPFKYPSRSVKNWLRYLSNTVNYPCAWWKLRKLHVDLIHSNSSIMDIPVFLKKALGVPLVWHLREFGDLDFNLKPILGRAQERFNYRFGDRFIAISQSVKSRFLPIIDSRKVDVVYNGIPLHKENAPVPDRSQGDTVQFCITGAINEAKRQTDVIEAFNILVNEKGLRNIHLTVIGEGQGTLRLKQLISHYGLEKYVTMAGWQPSPAEIYRNMDVGLMLSENEAFGRVTVEYMRAGLLVIASDGGANPEIVTHGETGYLFPTGNVGELAKVIEYAVHEPLIRKETASRGYEYSRTRFLSQENTASIYKIYRDIHGTNNS